MSKTVINNKFQKYLERLGYSPDEISVGLTNSGFTHTMGSNTSLTVKYILTPSKEDVFKEHKKLWNQNTDVAFIAVGGERSHLINVTQKPDLSNPLKKGICLQSFEYGINSDGYLDTSVEQISKAHIESGYLFDFISRHQKKGQSVDKDLLLNLLALKYDLIQNKNEKTIHLLILRCLFVKYLEDRGIFDKGYLLDILESGKPERLLSAFDEICKINGDIFKFDKFNVSNIKVTYLQCLTRFFKNDYRSQLISFFPYEFDHIPIQVISHVYEAFLKSKIKKGKGIYYTPPFLVNFMLAQSLPDKLQSNSKTKILDPAVGSGAFLVEGFRMIQSAQGGNVNFAQKKKILENQLFGIDNDGGALQIAAFSLYLALLETEKPQFIRKEIERANPILPSLIGKTLILGNTITDNIFENKQFDFIVSNPPWGAVPTIEADSENDPEENEENRKEREAIDNKKGAFPEYQYIADYERSQAFTVRVKRWSLPDTIFVMVVKNSIFLNDRTVDFRKEFLTNYNINIFYELSQYNKILFKKKEIGVVSGEKIVVGANEPAVVIVFQNKSTDENILTYISPKLNRFSEHFDLIQYTNNDRTEIRQSQFYENDLLWKILMKGDYEDYELIQKLRKTAEEIKSENIRCNRGFEATKDMERTAKASWMRTLIKSKDLGRYYIKNKLSKFDWNQKLARPREDVLYEGDRILIAYRPIPNDNFKLRCIQVNEDMVFRNDILCFQVDGVKDHAAYLALLNSSLMGYYIYAISSQWDGGLKREALRSNDIKSFNFDKLLNADVNKGKFKTLVKKINNAKNTNEIESAEKEIDDYILSNSVLLDYEREIVREFYEIKVKRSKAGLDVVKEHDIQAYLDAFSKTFALILSGGKSINAQYHISSNFGAIVCISIVNDNQFLRAFENNNLQVLKFVKNKQLGQVDSMGILNEGKVKIYEKEQFYIIKSNQFKDWTVRQGIRDAKEEIQQFIKHLSQKK